MATKRIIAYFMHEAERDQARPLLQNAEETDSFLMGDIDEHSIAAVKNAGLIVEEMAAVPGLRSPQSLEAVHGAMKTKLLSSRSSTPMSGAAVSMSADTATDAGFYLVQLRGPLVESWRIRLQRMGIELAERYPNRVYKARLTPQQVQQLSNERDIVEGLREFDASDTGPDIVSSSAANRTTGVAMLSFDVRLHREEDAPAVLRWLEERHVPIAGTSRRKIRVYLLRNSPLIEDIPALREVQAFAEYVPPKLSNDRARGLMGIDLPNPGAALGLDGAGEIVGVADTGIDQTHPDFANRFAGIVALGRPNDPSDPNGHGTHVAGSIAGDGSASGGQVRGAAPAAQIFFQSIMDADGRLGGLPVDLNDLFDEAYQNGARIHNNSWGAATQSMYTINSTEVDEFVATHRDMLILIAAGNEGTSAAPQNSAAGFVDWLSLGSPASCKNALTVGASRSDRTTGGISTLTWGQVWPQDFPNPPIADQLVSGDPECLAAFSSRGPCDDRRIKPDLVAPGTDILSTKSSVAPLANFWGPFPGNPKYAFMGGTSMATPLVAGCAALVRQYFVQQRQHKPSAALLKAALINGTRRLTGVDAIAARDGDPNYHQGHGCVDMLRTVPNPSRPNFRLEFIDNWQNAADQFATTGERRRYQLNVPPGVTTLNITLAYTDLPARALQNNLSLFLQQLPSGQKWMGNMSLPDSLNIPDPDNNVERIRILNPPAGNYLIQITATNILRGPQDFALVVAGEEIGQLIKV
jgi:subtilisin family serine protease